MIKEQWVTADYAEAYIQACCTGLHTFKIKDPDTWCCGQLFYYVNHGNYHFIFKDYSIKDKKARKIHLVVDGYMPYDEKVAASHESKQGYGKKAINILKEYCKKYGEDFDLKNNKDFVVWGSKTKDIICSTYQYFNPLYAQKEIEHAWGYDMNSCYPYFLTQPLPCGDDLGPGIVELDEMGFNMSMSSYEYGKKKLVAVEIGEEATYRFKLKIYKGFVDFASELFDKKKTDKEFKLILNALVGNIKYHNVFIRGAILHYAGQYMRSLMDQNTLFCTVDSIVSTVKRDDLPLGAEIGQFKCEHRDDPVYYVTAKTYKWSGSNPKISYPGVNESARVGDLIYTDTCLQFNPDQLKLEYIEQPKEKITWLKNLESKDQTKV